MTGSANGVRLTAFDRALELLALGQAAEAYASRRGDPGSAGYRRAWLSFRRRFHSLQELREWRASAASRTQTAGGPRVTQLRSTPLAAEDRRVLPH